MLELQSSQKHCEICEELHGSILHVMPCVWDGVGVTFLWVFVHKALATSWWSACTFMGQKEKVTSPKSGEFKLEGACTFNCSELGR